MIDETTDNRDLRLLNKEAEELLRGWRVWGRPYHLDIIKKIRAMKPGDRFYFNVPGKGLGDIRVLTHFAKRVIKRRPNLNGVRVGYRLHPRRIYVEWPQ